MAWMLVHPDSHGASNNNRGAKGSQLSFACEELRDTQVLEVACDDARRAAAKL